MIEIVKVENIEEKQIEQLINLWKDSVIATHHFLPAEEIYKLTPFVAQALASIETLLLCYSSNEITGFIGIQDRKIEMLFVSPHHFRNGIGKHLISLAINEYQAIFVDVNEENTEAYNFYKSIGFSTFARLELDDFGNPYPILQMQLASKKQAQP